ncbi:MAG: response regulator [Acidobacteriota bacterium]|nr:response regulator [Acidobacteriota bacterium]
MNTILFVDDMEMIRNLMCNVLRRSGYSVLEAEDGWEALSLARRQSGPIDLLITDIAMPRVGGLELRRDLRASHPESSALFISGHCEAELELDAPFLRKPFTPASLLSLVSEILSMRAAPIDNQISNCGLISLIN